MIQSKEEPYIVVKASVSCLNASSCFHVNDTDSQNKSLTLLACYAFAITKWLLLKQEPFCYLHQTITTKRVYLLFEDFSFCLSFPLELSLSLLLLSSFSGLALLS